MILEGNNVIMENRRIMGATDPKNAEPNTIRKLYGISIDKNSVHGSDSSANAKIEIDFFLVNSYLNIDPKMPIFLKDLFSLLFLCVFPAILDM